MRLHEVTFQNFRCFGGQTLRFGDANVQLVVAPNGGGKSAVIDAAAAVVGQVAFALGGVGALDSAPILHSDVQLTHTFDAGRFVASTAYPCAVHACATVLGKEVRWARALNAPTSAFNEKKRQAASLFEHIGQATAGVESPGTNTIPVLARYGTSRFVRAAVPRDGGEESPPESLDPDRVARDLAASRARKRFDGYESAFDAQPNWDPIRRWWAHEEATAAMSGAESTPALDAVRGALGVVMDGAPPPRFHLDVVDVLFSVAPSSSWLPFSRLSDGYRVVFALLADIARRASLLNPHLLAEARNSPGVVLIDEIDQHLHPSWQRLIVQQLRQAFPNIQFIVTTHAPTVLVGAGTENIQVHVIKALPNGEMEFGRFDYQAGLSVDQVLTGEWFKQASTLDDATIRLIARQAALYRGDLASPLERAEYDRISQQLEDRLGSDRSSSVEALVASVVHALSAEEGVELERLPWERLQEIRAEAIRLIRSAAQ